MRVACKESEGPLMQSKNLWDYYTTLGVVPGASAQEIHQSYRSLVKRWHPDRFVHDQRSQLKAEEKLKEINEAYSVLRVSSQTRAASSSAGFYSRPAGASQNSAAG